MTRKRKKPGENVDESVDAESAENADSARKDGDTQDADQVIEAEFTEGGVASESSSGEGLSEEVQAGANEESETAQKTGDVNAATAATLALAAGAADKQEAAHHEVTDEKEERGPARFVYAWLLILTVFVIGGLYIMLVNPDFLRDRMALAEAPALRNQASATKAVGKQADDNAQRITANMATIAEVQALQEETEAAAKAAGASAIKALSVAEAVDAVGSAPNFETQAALNTLNEKLSGLNAQVSGMGRVLNGLKAAASKGGTGSGDPIDGLALAAAAETADDALAAAEAAKAAAADLGGRMDAIASTVEKLNAQVAVLVEKASKRGPVSLAEAILALQDLRTGVVSGKPFATLLGRAQAALPDATALQNGPWVAFANDGLPTQDSLANDMQDHALAIARDNLKSKLKTGEDSWLDKAVGGVVERLKVRRVGAGVAGSDPAAVAARAEAALQEGNLSKAIQEVEALEGEDAARFAGWLAKARAAASASTDLDAVQKAAIAAADGA